MANSDTTDKVLAFLAASYPNFKLQPETVEAYAEMLADVPPDLLKAAAKQCVAASRFFPTVAELRDAALALMPQQSGLPTAGEAWAEVCQQIRRTGSYGKPEFSTPLIGRAVDSMGGWKMLCMSEDPMPDRAHFFRVYEALAQRATAQAKMLPEVRVLAEELRAKALGDGKAQP